MVFCAELTVGSGSWNLGYWGWRGFGGFWDSRTYRLFYPFRFLSLLSSTGIMLIHPASEQFSYDINNHANLMRLIREPGSRDRNHPFIGVLALFFRGFFTFI